MGINEYQEKTNEELFLLYCETHDGMIRQALTLRFVYIVKAVAFQMRDLYSDFMQMEDIVNEGVIEVMKAIDRYDPTRDNKFESYVSRRVRGMVIDIMRKNDWMPRSFHKSRKSIDDANDFLTKELGHTPSEAELSDYLHMDVKQLRKVQRLRTMTNVLSLDMSYPESNEKQLQVISEDIEGQPEEKLLKGETVKMLTEAIEQLGKNEKTVISLYYVEELSMNQIAEVMGISQPRVSQLHRSAILRLKKYMEKYN
ncbi:sigma-70 family RNA polymerase sigma factor [Oribacterium sp. HCP28S3_H8]|jgi:RNA polymerase sigma factor for flagellar operon FliA|uniref:sigma-70 family RNA polymerase sigma factor n=1 Tax=Oribacterium sp. HCP28S3_H8 TaxID=3438945 RepID=UPI003F8BA787